MAPELAARVMAGTLRTVEQLDAALAKEGEQIAANFNQFPELKRRLLAFRDFRPPKVHILRCKRRVFDTGQSSEALAGLSCLTINRDLAPQYSNSMEHFDPVLVRSTTWSVIINPVKKVLALNVSACVSLRYAWLAANRICMRSRSSDNCAYA